MRILMMLHRPLMTPQLIYNGKIFIDLSIFHRFFGNYKSTSR
ncbi:hypothetical protein V6Z11_D10G241200 [Gossypium hirsutum]